MAVFADYTVVDGLEDVWVKNAAGGVLAAVRALRGSLSYADITLGSSVGYRPTDGVWMLAAYGTIPPEPGCTITDYLGVLWTIIGVTVMDGASLPWKCVARKQV